VQIPLGLVPDSSSPLTAKVLKPSSEVFVIPFVAN